jgi:S1-C subfamily serine protease
LTNDGSFSDSGAWPCPACDRRVPARIRECRCGYVQDGADPSAADARDTSGARRSNATGLSLLAFGLLVGAGLALLPAPRTTPPPAAQAVLAPPLGLDEPVDVAEDDPLNVPADPSDTALTPQLPALGVPLPISNSVAMAAPLEDLVSRVVPAVAFVQAGQARGTGFFITRDRLLTNAHVIAGHTIVRLQVGEANYEARVGTVSTGTDLAVLQVINPSPTQQVLRLGAVGQARVGEEVIAVGSALGVLSNTVTRGIVSAVRQVGQVTLIQTDAAINPGNSGGPLISRSGLVIGVNSLRVAQQTAEGVAFAVAIDHATQLLNGQRASDNQTPLNSLTQMLGGRSDSDDQRARGEQDYTRILEWAAKSAGELDNYWNRYAGTCVTAARSVGDRAWFAVYEKSGVTLGTNTSVNCGSWLDTVRTNAGRIREEVEKAAETARQRGVYPGTVRDLRRRHRLQWTGWDR